MVLSWVATTDGQKPVPISQESSGLLSRPWEALPAGTAAALRPGLERTADEIIDAIRAGVPAYARPLEGAFGEGIRRGVAEALEEFIDTVEGNGRRREPEEDINYALGRGEAREGRALEALLAAYRIGARVAWRRTAATARQAGLGADALALLAEAIFAYIDELSARSAEGFAYEQSLAAGETARRRRVLLGLMVQRPPADPAAVQAAAAEAGWPLPAEVAAVIWEDDRDQRVAGRMPLGSLAATLPADRHCALVPDAGAPGRRAEVEGAVGRRTAALGPSVPWSDSWRSAERALGALDLAREGLLPGGALLVASEHLPELMVLGRRQLLDELAVRALAPLDERTPGSRARLLETLRSWLDHQGRVPEVAEALHVHPQTVRYRLAQLREAFGDDLDDPQARFALTLAVRAPTGS